MFNIKKKVIIAYCFVLLMTMGSIFFFPSLYYTVSETSNWSPNNGSNLLKEQQEFPKLQSAFNNNYDNIMTTIENRLDEFILYGYYPQIYKPSLQATYYVLYILEALESLDQVNHTTLFHYIMSHYSEETHIFMDAYAYRHKDTSLNESSIPFPYTSILETNCYAVLALNILDSISLFDQQAMVDFIWSCYNPEEEANGFTGQPYSPDTEDYLRLATMDNTYFAIKTLELLMENWDNYYSEKIRIVSYINDLQTPGSSSWSCGGFCNDYSPAYDSLGDCMWEANLLSDYYCLKSLELFDLIDTIRMDDFYLHLGVLYEEEQNLFHMHKYADWWDIVASALGLDLTNLTNYEGINQSAVLTYLRENRNESGNWDSSSNNQINELINTFQIIRSLKESGYIQQLSIQEKEEIITSLDLYYQYGGYSIFSKQETTLGLIYDTIHLFDLCERLPELDLDFIYSELEERYNKITDPTRVLFSAINLSLFIRAKPIEFYNEGYHNFTQETERIMNQRMNYMALESLKKIFKLDNFHAAYNLTKLKDTILNCQFLESGFENYGAFLPYEFSSGISPSYKNRKIILEDSYYAIKSLDLLSDLLGFDSILDFCFERYDLYDFITRNIIETDELIYFNPLYTQNIEAKLKCTFFIIETLQMLNLFSLNIQKIAKFVIQNINYANLENVYWAFKIDNILSLDIQFNNSRTQTLIENLYCDETNEFFSDLSYQETTQENLRFILEMSKNDPLEINCSYDQQLILGQIATMNTTFQNMILTDFGSDVSVTYENSHLGSLQFEKQGDSTYFLMFKVPEDANFFPELDGIVRIYEHNKMIGQKPIIISTTFMFHYSGIEVLKQDNYFMFVLNLSYEFYTGQTDTSNSSVIARILKNEYETETQILEQTNYPKWSRYTLYFNPQEGNEYVFSFYLQDEFFPTGRLLGDYRYYSDGNPSNPLDPSPPDSSPVPALFISGISVVVILAIYLYIRKRRRRLNIKLPANAIFKIENKESANDVVESLFHSKE